MKKKSDQSGIQVLTVPEKWAWPSSVRGTTYYDKIVGMISQDGRDIWIPNNPKKYLHNGQYSDGYSKKEAEERKLELSKPLAKNIFRFFDKYLINKGWYDMPHSAELYDCHWFANYVSNKQNGSISTDESLDKSDDIVRKGTFNYRKAPKEQLGVIGFKAAYKAAADHSIIGINDSACIQVMGLHGALSISPTEGTVEHYLEISDHYDWIEDLGKSAIDCYGVYVK